jgi:hypothetical protein
MQEIYKAIPGYEGLYEVSNMGNVKSLSRVDLRGHRVNERIRRPTLVMGYPRVCLNKDGKKKNFMIHKLMAMAFLGHKPNGHKKVIDHINNIKTDNRIENLQITTNRHNVIKDTDRGVSKYVGVCWFKPTSKWLSKIRIQGKQLHLGLFEDELEASNAYQKMLNAIQSNPDLTYDEAKKIKEAI